LFDCPLGIEITLVTDYHNEGFLSSDFPNIIYPPGQAVEGVSICIEAMVLVISKTITAALESFI
jgi:hypothetical protein